MKIEIVLERDIFAESIRAVAQRGSVLDLGGHAPLQKKGLRELTAQFAQTRYFCTDIVPAPGLDFLGDALSIPLLDGSVEAVTCRSVLEHVYEPNQVAREIFRVLQPGGVAFIYVPFLQAYHGVPGKTGSVDCYRFSLDAIEYMFQCFALIRVQPVDRAVETALRLLAGRHGGLEKRLRSIGRTIDRRRGPGAGLYQASGYNVWLEKDEDVGT